mgnify:CR=1 FL=1
MRIKKHTIQNKHLRISTLNIGASLFEVILKPKKHNLILNLGSISNYKLKHQYIGSTCGRFANRIYNSQFKINGKKYYLSKNDGHNTLHGGKRGFDKKLWNIIDYSKTHIIYQLVSEDLDQGFPGNLKVNCEYRIDKNKLACKYYYISDKYTHVNLTNHCYWNLNKNKKNKIFNHDLKINANYYLPVNKNNIPFGYKKSVKSTRFDFTSSHNIGLKTFEGKKSYDINFITGTGKLHSVATLINKNEKIKIILKSNQPGLQFYTGHKLNRKKNPKLFFPYQGVCLETQYFPNTPNEKSFPSTLVLPNKKYVKLTYYQFENL